MLIIGTKLWNFVINKLLTSSVFFLSISESAVEDCCMKDYSPFSPQRSDCSTPSSLYMESREFSDFRVAVLNKVLWQFQYSTVLLLLPFAAANLPFHIQIFQFCRCSLFFWGFFMFKVGDNECVKSTIKKMSSSAVLAEPRADPVVVWHKMWARGC